MDEMDWSRWWLKEMTRKAEIKGETEDEDACSNEYSPADELPWIYLDFGRIHESLWKARTWATGFLHIPPAEGVYANNII